MEIYTFFKLIIYYRSYRLVKSNKITIKHKQDRLFRVLGVVTDGYLIIFSVARKCRLNVFFGEKGKKSTNSFQFEKPCLLKCSSQRKHKRKTVIYINDQNITKLLSCRFVRDFVCSKFGLQFNAFDLSVHLSIYLILKTQEIINPVLRHLRISYFVSLMHRVLAYIFRTKNSLFFF